MQILTENFGGVLVAHAPDELTDDAAHLLANTLRRSVDGGQTRVVLQMDRTDAFDSSGLAVLLELQDLLREAGGGVRICGLTESARKVFEITRLDRRLESFESLVDAVGSFR